jgi:hypothetical protein
MIWFLLLSLAASSAAADLPTRPFVSESTLSQRDFPLLMSLRNDKTLARDSVLARIATLRAEDYHRCGEDIACRLAALRFTPGQIGEIAARLSEGWQHEAEAINHIISVYGEGEKPRYAEIDSMSYAADSKSYGTLLRVILDGLDLPEADASSHPNLVFEPALRVAVRLLQANARDEAGRFWPLDSGENAAALRRVGSIDWSSFPYSVILVPGEGPEIVGLPLSPVGAERLRLAVAAWRDKQAPYLLLSGGFVHPAQTPFCEAVEMRRYLREVYDIPADAILIEPQARHTTTNIRNAVRQIFDYGLPAQKPMLIVSNPGQIDKISNASFAQRNQNELGYQPAALGKRLSPSRIEALPLRHSLYRDAAGDPLDP